MPASHKWEAKTQFWLGATIVIVTAIVQAVILYNNASFTLHAFGGAFLIIYLSAATCYIVLPWIAEHIEEFASVHWTRMCLLAFCFWITLEEHLHAAHAFQAPQGVTAVASVFFSAPTAANVAILFVVAVLLAVVEFQHHLHHHGAHLMKRNYKMAYGK